MIPPSVGPEEDTGASAKPTGPAPQGAEPLCVSGTAASPSRKKKNTRACGSRFELESVKFLCAGGIDARKRWMSGQLDGGGDIEIHQHWDEVWSVECKWKALMPKWLINALGNHKAVFFKQSRGEPLVLMRLSDFRSLCQ